jgi:hypothetical protein
MKFSFGSAFFAFWKCKVVLLLPAVLVFLFVSGPSFTVMSSSNSNVPNMSVAQVTKQRRIWKCGEKIKKKKRASQPEDF